MKGKEIEGDQKIPALAGEKWRSMSDKEKEKYKQLEAGARKKHDAAMEEWRKKVSNCEWLENFRIAGNFCSKSC